MTEVIDTSTGEASVSPAQKWQTEIDKALKEMEKFHTRARKVNRRYVDERDAVEAQNKWFNIFYANTVILESALYAQLPKPDVSRRFKDYKDDIARVGANILQRNLSQDMDDPRDTFDEVMKQCVQDRLVAGLAQSWVRLETTTTGTAADQTLRITDQRVIIDYVFWEDFIWSPCRVWSERRWVGRRVYLDKDEVTKRFGKDKANQLVYKETSGRNSKQFPQDITPEHSAVSKAEIFEIWCRTSRKVIWVSRNIPLILEEIDDPLKLMGFDPCPRPMLANISTSNTVPRPDYYMIQDQYNELDTVNNRISLLVQACKVIGVYDRGSDGVQRMLQEGFDNTLIPVDNWAMFAEKGGVKGQVDWLPLEQVVNALQRLQEAREQIKAQIYELTGIADIVRGASKASETLGAQQIKAQFASVRIKRLQDEVARFAADMLRLKAEVLVRHVDPEILISRSNIMNTDDADMVPQAMELIKSEEGFEWRIEIAPDSLAQADYAMEKQDRTELLMAVSSYIEKALPMVQAIPQSATLIIGMLKWAVAAFRGARDIEGLLDKALDELVSQPPQNKPDPEQEKAQAESQKIQQQTQASQMKAQIDIQAKQADAAIKQKAAQMDLQAKQQELGLKAQENQMDFRAAVAKMALDVAGGEEEGENEA